MQILGRVTTLEEARTRALEISQESGFLCVYEKAKYKTTSDEPPSGRYLRCWRLWLDRDRPGMGIMDINDWSPPKEVKEPVKPKSHITQLYMRNKLTNPFYRQGRF